MPRSTEIRRLLEAVAAMSSDLSLPVVLRRIVVSACELVGAQYAALGVLGPGTNVEQIRLIEFITEGTGDEVIRAIGHYPVGRGILGVLIRDPRPLRLHDIAGDPRSYGFPPGHPPMRSFLGVPVRIQDQVFGNLYLTEKRGGGDFTPGDEEMVIGLAGAAGVAIENARLRERVSQLAVLEDRERIARDLHDTVIQRLFATGLGLQAVTHVTAKPEVADRIQQAVDDLDTTIRDIRGVIFALQAHERGEQSLRVRVLSLLTEMKPPLGFEPRAHFDGPVDSAIDDVLAGDLLAVLRELLSNVAHHAGATSADIYLLAGSEIILRVEDDGRGPGPARVGGRGLKNLEARARVHGGSFALVPKEWRGSLAEWRVPRRLPGDAGAGRPLGPAGARRSTSRGSARAHPR
jgi:signal transduction histidine kinase